MKLINTYWPRLGGVFSLGILGNLLISELVLTDIQFLLSLHLALLLQHQFEEYQFPGGFKDYFNTNIYKKSRIIRFPLNDTAIFIVNVIIAWTAYIYSALHPNNLWLALGLFCITFFNGFLHSFLFFRKKKYNPGFYTGFFLFIPFCSYALYTLSEALSKEDWILGLLIFVIGTATIPGSIYLSNKL
jgi:hypothetical protein